jgi:hypothetical protein
MANDTIGLTLITTMALTWTHVLSSELGEDLNDSMVTGRLKVSNIC